tara:strand:- start:5165 stop:5374 length:210 start_codon:yes stop_codon:yes gene_type:complete
MKEFTEAILKTELTDATLSADVADAILPIDTTENADISVAILINDKTDRIVKYDMRLYIVNDFEVVSVS